MVVRKVKVVHVAGRQKVMVSHCHLNWHHLNFFRDIIVRAGWLADAERQSKTKPHTNRNHRQAPATLAEVVGLLEKYSSVFSTCIPRCFVVYIPGEALFKESG